MAATASNRSTPKSVFEVVFDSWWGGIVFPLSEWLPVEISIIAIIGGLMYVILQHEGFTTG